MNRPLRAMVMATGFHSALLLLYVVARVTLTSTWAGLDDPFFFEVPQLTFLAVGVLSLALCAGCVILYIALWRSRGETTPASGQGGPMSADVVEGSRLLGRAVLAVWLLSLLAWCTIVAWILAGGCACDLHTSLFGDISHINAVTLGMAAFILSFLSMFAYLARWWTG